MKTLSSLNTAKHSIVQKYTISQLARPSKQVPAISGDMTALPYSRPIKSRGGRTKATSKTNARRILFVSFSIVAVLISRRVTSPPWRTTYFRSDTVGSAKKPHMLGSSDESTPTCPASSVNFPSGVSSGAAFEAFSLVYALPRCNKSDPMSTK